MPASASERTSADGRRTEMRAASGVRVLEVGERLGAAAAGLALAALGADVAQVRLPGRRVPPAEAVYYDRGRLAVEVSAMPPNMAGGVHDPASATLADIAARADVVITDLDEAVLGAVGVPSDVDTLRGGDRPQVLVSIRSLGRHGPSSGFRMTDLTEWAAGGLATVTRRPHLDDPDRYVPVLPPGCQPQALAGLAAATAAFAARRWARARREPVVADVSVQEVTAATLHSTVPNFVWNGHVLGHPGTPTTALGFLVPALDGDVYIRTVEGHQWERLMDWLGRPQWADLGVDPTDRYQNRSALETLIGEWTATRASRELLVEGQRRRVPIAVPRTLAEVLAWQHLRARGAWCQVEYRGVAAEAPRLPMLEPAAWPSTRVMDLDEVARRWEAVR